MGGSMEASVVDLRYKMNKVLKALARKERVKILFHGRVKGTIIPEKSQQHSRIADHPFFGMKRGAKEPVETTLQSIRQRRYHDL
jgi:hypothetical protein